MKTVSDQASPFVKPNIQIQILQTDLHTFPWRIGWEILFADQSFSHQKIVLLILTTFSLDYVLILCGEKLTLVSDSWDLKG